MDQFWDTINEKLINLKSYNKKQPSKPKNDAQYDIIVPSITPHKQYSVFSVSNLMKAISTLTRAFKLHSHAKNSMNSSSDQLTLSKHETANLHPRVDSRVIHVLHHLRLVKMQGSRSVFQISVVFEQPYNECIY